MYVIAFQKDHYVTIPDHKYFGEIYDIFDSMQEDGVRKEEVANIGAFEDDGVFWDKSKREGAVETDTLDYPKELSDITVHFLTGHYDYQKGEDALRSLVARVRAEEREKHEQK